MASEKSSRASHVMGGRSKKSGKKSSKKPHSIHVRRGKSGGFIAEHHFKNTDPGEMNPEPEEHVLPDISSLQDHMAQHMGDQPDQQAEPAPEPAPPAGPPAAAAPGPAAGAPGGM